jgi:hypothetical protein
VFIFSRQLRAGFGYPDVPSRLCARGWSHINTMFPTQSRRRIDAGPLAARARTLHASGSGRQRLVPDRRQPGHQRGRHPPVAVRVAAQQHCALQFGVTLANDFY